MQVALFLLGYPTVQPYRAMNGENRRCRAATPAIPEKAEQEYSFMKRWVKPAFINRRLGFEINLYINSR